MAKREITVIIAGMSVKFASLTKAELRSLPEQVTAAYELWRGQMSGNAFVLLRALGPSKPAPLKLKSAAARVEAELGVPGVFVFDALPTYERNRLVQRGVYFVVSGKYAFMPYLLINARESRPVRTQKLLPSAQYLILHQAQAGDLNGHTLQQMERELPLQYVTLSRGVRQLVLLGLVQTSEEQSGAKTFHIDISREAFWKRALPLMQSPVRIVYYADSVPELCRRSGPGALEHYASGKRGGAHSAAASDVAEPTVALYDYDYRRMLHDGSLRELSREGGEVRVEIWKYPPLCDGDTVDPLSLYLSLAGTGLPELKPLVGSLADTAAGSKALAATVAAALGFTSRRKSKTVPVPAPDAATTASSPVPAPKATARPGHAHPAEKAAATIKPAPALPAEKLTGKPIAKGDKPQARAEAATDRKARAGAATDRKARAETVVRMYLEGQSAKDIRLATGLKTDTGVYLILKKHGVELRGHASKEARQTEQAEIAAIMDALANSKSSDVATEAAAAERVLGAPREKMTAFAARLLKRDFTTLRMYLEGNPISDIVKTVEGVNTKATVYNVLRKYGVRD